MTPVWCEPVLPGDRYADYCQWPYDPPAPVGGKWRQVSLLWLALDAAGADPRLAAACRELRRALGGFRTVYGVKLADGRLSFEFYFYDYDRLDRSLSIPRVLSALSPFVRCELPPVERRPYFMFSLDLDDAIVSGRAPLAEIDVYVGNPGSTVSSGICYAHRSEGLELKNFYFFFDARAERAQIADKVATSAYLDAGRDLEEILWPELRDCGVVVVANKRNRDGVYFSRIRASQFQHFLYRAGWPAAIAGAFDAELPRFDHLLYDVGIDYAVEDGRVVITKSAFYGLL
ncbi:MAG: hypothetical protein IPK28_04670 [Devosia sp.]|nr:hypothetical protein [Devosia sp.]